MFERDREVAAVFNIQCYSTHDGPGVYTIAFLKGYSLGCRWCQNLESRTCTQNLLHDPRFCLGGCELCVKTTLGVVERVLSDLLTYWGKLAPECPTALADYCLAQALAVCSEVKSVEEAMATVLRDKPFYDRSSGDLALSGGKLFMQPKTATALLQANHEVGIYIIAETCLHVPWKYIASLLPHIDLFLAGLRHVADVPLKQWTDGNAIRVLDNLEKLVIADKKIIIRVPLIRGFSADKISVKAITNFAADELHVDEIHFLPYHMLGADKYHLPNLSYDVSEKPLDTPELFDFAQQYVCQKGLAVILRG